MDKKLLSLVLGILMMLTMFPFSIIAEEENTDIPETEPVVIESSSTEETEPERERESVPVEPDKSENVPAQQPAEKESFPEEEPVADPTQEQDQESEQAPSQEEPPESEPYVPADDPDPESTETSESKPTEEPTLEPAEEDDNSDPGAESAPEEETAEEVIPETEEPGDADAEDENQAEPESPAETEEQEEAEVILSLNKLRDVRIVNGSAEFSVKATCSSEEITIRYQWQKLDTKGAYTEIADPAERARAREAAWENIGSGTSAKLRFQDIGDYSVYENLLFRCRVTAGDAVAYTEEVKLLPEEKAEESGRLEETEAEESVLPESAEGLAEEELPEESEKETETGELAEKPETAAETGIAEKLQAEEPTEEQETEPEQETEDPLSEQEAISEPEADAQFDEEEPDAEGRHIASAYRDVGVAQDDTEKLFVGFVNQQMGKSGSRKGQKFAGAGDSLTGPVAIIYQTVSSGIHENAIGERASTFYIITTSSMGMGETIRWTAEELGVEQVWTEEDGIVNEVWAKLYTTLDMDLLYSALRADYPYDLYWIDITKGFTYGPYCVLISENNDWIELGGIQIGFYVALPYQDGDQFTVNTTIGSTVVSAGNNAKAIVAQYAGVSDYEKLRGYRREICDLVEYNEEAYYESQSGTISSSDPWLVIWVFDDDPDTNVVCEGYSKAFQHLCDLTDFKTSIRCMTVSGDAGGAHMWNVVSMEDGYNYLVDVTWCDSWGNTDAYFLRGYDKGSESVYPKYVIRGAERTYNQNSMALYGESKLSLSDHNYVISTGIVMGQLPDKTDYVPGEEFDLTGGTILLQYSDGATEEISLLAEEVTVSGFSTMAPGTQLLTVAYKGFSTSFEISMASNKCGPNLTWSFDVPSGTLVMTGYGMMDSYNPSSEEQPWALVRNEITSVSLPGELTGVGKYAFSDCSELTSVIIPNRVVSIDEAAFQNCSNMVSVLIPDNVTIIGQNAFAGCSSLTDIHLGNGVTIIDECAFSNCRELMSITIPGSVTDVGTNAFSGCSRDMEVYYLGTRLQKEQIHIEEYNDSFVLASWHYMPLGPSASGWYLIDNVWYFLGDDGEPLDGWQKISNKWYWFDNWCIMQTGWKQIDRKWYYFNPGGNMVTGWKQLGGNWYYFNPGGNMVTGWKQLSGRWYYFHTSGTMVTGWQKYCNSWYYFNASGSMVTGWQKISNKWYYFNTSGVMVTGWQHISGNWYYFESGGAMLANTTATINGKRYTFDGNGIWQPDLQ